MSGKRFLPHPSDKGEKRVVVDGWGEDAALRMLCGVWKNCSKQGGGTSGSEGEVGLMIRSCLYHALHWRDAYFWHFGHQ